jgi:hypothetical protein
MALAAPDECPADSEALPSCARFVLNELCLESVPPRRASAKRIERVWTGDDASLESIEAPPTALKRAVPRPRRGSAKAREGAWRGGVATGPAYSAYQVLGFPTPEDQWTGDNASD